MYSVSVYYGLTFAKKVLTKVEITKEVYPDFDYMIYPDVLSKLLDNSCVNKQRSNLKLLVNILHILKHSISSTNDFFYIFSEIY